MIALYKSVPVNEPENCRPILILPILYQLLERAVQEQIRDYSEEISLIRKFHFDFRPNRSTQQVTISLTGKIRLEANDKKLLGTLFLDLGKAFNIISHVVLLSKLKDYGIYNEELEWFASYLFYRNQVVDFNNKRSNEFYIYSGVSTVSHIFYLFSRSKVLVYAKDTVIYYAHSDINVIEKVLNEDMSLILSKLYYIICLIFIKMN